MVQSHEIYSMLSVPNDRKIVLLVVDGLGGASHPEFDHRTELEYASRPNLDRLAAGGTTGLLTPVLPGVSPGSGPGHLGLFGYDPLSFQIGRGVLEALGVGLHPGPNDVFARGNFCVLDENGVITDRRANRLQTSSNEELLQLLSGIRVPGVTITLHPVLDYRFVFCVSGTNLGDKLDGTDPGGVGKAPKLAEGDDAASANTAKAINMFVSQARDMLKGDSRANGLILRGFSKLPTIPSLDELYGIKSVGIAVYPMYKGLARIAGMALVDAGSTIEEQVAALRENWHDYDFFFVHYKYTDSAGEDGDFELKAKHIEIVDRVLPDILDLRPSVLIVTGDHSTPSVLGSHSWHPIPLVLGSDTCRRDSVTEFTESACSRGGFGHLESKHLIGLALAHALRLGKFGA